MDIYSAKSYMKKISKYVESISKSNRALYSNSIAQLKSLSNDLESANEMILDIIRNNAFQEKEVEFEGLSDFSSIGKEIITVQDCKQAFHLYSSTLVETSYNKSVPGPVSECAAMIWYWFERRFLSDASTFSYNFESLPEWIESIVIKYGKELNYGREAEFISNFQSWCDSIELSSNNYGVPYEIYKVKKHPSPSDPTLASVILWDVLIDCGYSALCNKQPASLYLTEDEIYNYSGNLNPSVLDRYVDFKDDPTILDVLNERGEI